MSNLSIHYNNHDLLAQGLCDPELYTRFSHQYRNTASGIELHYFDFESNQSHTLDSEYATPGYKITLCTEGFSENNSPAKEKYFFEPNRILYYKLREGRSQSLVKGPGPVRILHLYLPETFVSETSRPQEETFVSSALSAATWIQARQLITLPCQSMAEKIRGEYQLFEFLSSLFQPLERGALLSGSNHCGILEAKEYLDGRQNNLVSIKELAKLVGVNEYKLKKEFKALTGKGVFEYQHERLMKEAYTWLRDGMSIAEVAEKAGYSSAGNFSNAFYKTFGFRPGLFNKS